MENKNYGFETLMIHAGFDGEASTHSVVPPLYNTNAYTFNYTNSNSNSNTNSNAR